MNRRIVRLGIGLILLGPCLARAGEDGPRRPPRAAIGGEGLHRVGAESAPDRGRPAEGGSTGAWWLGPVGLALALAGWGALSVANRRKLAGSTEAGTLKVVGRLSLSPRHAIHQVRVGDRVLLIGTGSQGPPALLGELSATGGDA